MGKALDILKETLIHLIDIIEGLGVFFLYLTPLLVWLTMANLGVICVPAWKNILVTTIISIAAFINGFKRMNRRIY